MSWPSCQPAAVLTPTSFVSCPPLAALVSIRTELAALNFSVLTETLPDPSRVNEPTISFVPGGAGRIVEPVFARERSRLGNGAQLRLQFGNFRVDLGLVDPGSRAATSLALISSTTEWSVEAGIGRVVFAAARPRASPTVERALLSERMVVAIDQYAALSEALETRRPEEMALCVSSICEEMPRRVWSADMAAPFVIMLVMGCP